MRLIQRIAKTFEFKIGHIIFIFLGSLFLGACYLINFFLNELCKLVY